MSVSEQLRQALAEGRLVPFVGSGVSCGVDCGLPSWSELLLALGADLRTQGSDDAATLVETLVRLNRYSDAAEEAFRAYRSEHAYHETIARLFSKLVDGDFSVPLALWALHPKLILTTNYDRMLETANPGAKSITNKDDFALRDLERIHQEVVWHLHGSVDRPETIILAPSQYARLYRPNDTSHSLARATLHELLSRRALLFVGFGFNDFEVLGSVKEVLSLFEGAFPVSFAVLSKDDKSPRECEELWEHYRVTIIRVDDYSHALVKYLTELRASSTKALEAIAVLNALAQFNRRAALELGARHVSTHLHFCDKTKPAMVAPGRTSCGCITEEPLVAPIAEKGRFTVRLFSELLKKLPPGAKAATYTRDALRVGSKNKDFDKTVYGEPFQSLLAGLIEAEGEPIGVVKVENKLSDVDNAFDKNNAETLLRLIREFSPHLQQAHRWIQKQEWSEVRVFDADRK